MRSHSDGDVYGFQNRLKSEQHARGALIAQPNDDLPKTSAIHFAMEYCDLLEILDNVQSGQLAIDVADFSLHLQTYRDKFASLLKFKVGSIVF